MHMYLYIYVMCYIKHLHSFSALKPLTSDFEVSTIPSFSKSFKEQLGFLHSHCLEVMPILLLKFTTISSLVSTSLVMSSLLNYN